MSGPLDWFIPQINGVMPAPSDPLVQADKKQFQADTLAREAANLIPGLCTELVSKSLKQAQAPLSASWHGGLKTLCDGLDSLIHTVSALRGFFGLSRGDRARLDIMEDALSAVHRELVEAARRKQDELARVVLSEDLPMVLQAWASEGHAMLAPRSPG